MQKEDLILMGFCFVFRSHILHSKCMVAILKQQSTKLTIQWNGPRKSSNMFGCGFFITITAISCQYESVKSITESRTWVMVNFPTAKSTSWNYSNVRHTSLYSCFDLIWRHNWGWGGEELYFFKCTLFNQLTWGWGGAWGYPGAYHNMRRRQLDECFSSSLSEWML